MISENNLTSIDFIMKSATIVLVFNLVVFVSNVCIGQQERQKYLGIETAVSYDYLEDLELNFQLTYSIKQHVPFMGMAFPLNSDPVSNFGFIAGYKFFPNKSIQTFDFFFLYILQLESRKLYSTSTVNGFSLHNLIGYGIQVNFGKQIYLIHHLAGGIENAWFNDYGNFSDLSLSFNLGIGIKIKTLISGE